jgi:tetratricopeptide (TPR) repeat protein
MRRTILGLIVAIGVATGVAPARADDRVAAEELFLRAKELRKAGRTAEACDAFERSHKLDAQLGTKYNLALCYEDLGRLASAWGLYREIVQRDTKSARRKDAEDRAKKLHPRLTKMLITLVGPTFEGLAVSRNGADVTATVGIETAVDPGDYEIVATAPGYRTFTSSVRASGEGATVTVTIPLLEELIEDGAPPPDRPPVGPVDDDDDLLVDPGDPGRGRRQLGLIVGGGGVALAGTGLVFGALARGKWRDARAVCGDDLACESQADVDRGNAIVADARRLGNVATGLVVAGAVAVAAGVVLYLTAPSGGGGEYALRIAPEVGAGTAMVRLSGVLP